jgi:hypothetical protein
MDAGSVEYVYSGSTFEERSDGISSVFQSFDPQTSKINHAIGKTSSAPGKTGKSSGGGKGGGRSQMILNISNGPLSSNVCSYKSITSTAIWDGGTRGDGTNAFGELSETIVTLTKNTVDRKPRLKEVAISCTPATSCPNGTSEQNLYACFSVAYKSWLQAGL